MSNNGADTPNSPALRALARWVFRDDPSGLSWEDLRALHLEKFAAPLLRDRLPQGSAAECKRDHMALSMLDMKQEHAFAELEKLFRENRINYCPIKGADLAWRVWPSGAFRTKCDLDILVRREDHEKALQLLAGNGWSTPYSYRHAHHDAMMHKHDVALELHFLLPNFTAAATKEIIRDMRELSPCRHQLPLESNLLMLFTHSFHHKWQNGMQLLMDCGFLVRHEGKPDWKKLGALAKRCHVAPPSLLFKAFPDFFPLEAIPEEEEFSPETIAIFRKLILEEPPPKSQLAEKVMGDPERFSAKWWRNRFSALRPSSIRMQTGNPRGHYGKLLLGYWTIGRKKLGMFWNYRHGSGDAKLNERLRNEKRIEKLLSADESD